MRHYEEKILGKSSTECCSFCGRNFSTSRYSTGHYLAKTRDHIIPRSKGGINYKINLIDVCQTCNSFKSDMMPDEFFDKVRVHIKKRVGWRNISITLFEIILENSSRLINERINKHGDKLFRRGKVAGTAKDKQIAYCNHPKVNQRIIKTDLPVTEKWTQEQFDDFFRGKTHFHYYAP